MDVLAFNKWLSEEGVTAYTMGIEVVTECPVQPNLSGRFRLRNLRAGRYLLLGWMEQIPLSGQQDTTSSRRLWYEFTILPLDANASPEPLNLGSLTFE